MLTASTVTRPAAAAAAAARSAAPRRCLRSPAPFASPTRRSGLPPLRSSGKEEAAVRVAEDGAGHSEFDGLARQLAGSLASEFAKSNHDDSVYDKLSQWLRGSHEEAEEAQLKPRSAQAQAPEESTTKQLLRKAAESYGVPTTVDGALLSAKRWLSTPAHSEESHGEKPRGGAESHEHVQMAARLVHRLLDSYEKEHGQEFGGKDEKQYDQLYNLARGVLGSSVSKKVVTHLVRSYLKI